MYINKQDGVRAGNNPESGSNLKRGFWAPSPMHAEIKTKIGITDGGIHVELGYMKGPDVEWVPEPQEEEKKISHKH